MCGEALEQNQAAGHNSVRTELGSCVDKGRDCIGCVLYAVQHLWTMQCMRRCCACKCQWRMVRPGWVRQRHRRKPGSDRISCLACQQTLWVYTTKGCASLQLTIPFCPCPCMPGCRRAGSSRDLASYCSIAGFMPTHGRVSLEGCWSAVRRLDARSCFAEVLWLAQVQAILLSSMAWAPAVPMVRMCFESSSEADSLACWMLVCLLHQQAKSQRKTAVGKGTGAVFRVCFNKYLSEHF